MIKFRKKICSQIGACLASPLAGFCLERFGRKETLILFCAPYVLGWLVIAFSSSILMMIIGRFITGKSLRTELRLRGTVFTTRLNNSRFVWRCGHNDVSDLHHRNFIRCSSWHIGFKLHDNDCSRNHNNVMLVNCDTRCNRLKLEKIISSML